MSFRRNICMGLRRTFTLRWRSAEVLAWILGAVCVGVWAYEGVASRVGRREAISQFYDARAQAGSLTNLSSIDHPDQSLWSPERVRAWVDARGRPGPAPLGILRIRRLGIEVPILEGTGDDVLNRAVGHIEDTSVPGGHGNSGIAGHRDGFFRPLKDVRDGDVIEIETLRGVARYAIERSWIVDPDDVSVLDPTPADSITLVTCYPFYFIGSAPQRFIVRAVRAPS